MASSSTGNETSTIYVKEERNNALTKRIILSSKMPPSIHICIEGSIGAGKSTLLKKLYKYFKDNTAQDWYKLPEPLDVWTSYGPRKENLLDKMYKDPKTYGFLFQSMVLNSRVEQFKNYRHNKHSFLLVERSIECQSRVFSPVLRQQDSLTSTEYDVLVSLINNLAELPFYAPQIIIYLRCKPKVSMERIMQRKRGEEVNVTMVYLERLMAKYDQWLIGSRDPRVIEVDANDVEELNDMPKLFGRIMKTLPIRYRELITPNPLEWPTDITDEELVACLPCHTPPSYSPQPGCSKDRTPPPAYSKH